MIYPILLIGFTLVINTAMATLVSINLREINNRNFLHLFNCFVWWIIFEGINTLGSFSPETTLLLFKIAVIGWLPLGSVILLLTYGLVGRRADWFLKLCFALLLPQIYLSLTSDWLVSSVQNHQMFLQVVFGPGYLIATFVSGCIPFVMSLFILLHNILRTPEGNLLRGQIIWVFWGLMVAGNFILLVTVLLPIFFDEYSYRHLGITGSSILASFTYFAIYKNDLFDIYFSKSKADLFSEIFSHTHEAILVTNYRREIIEVNPAYEKITGFSRSEMLGNDPSMTSSGRHDESFYKQMWSDIERLGMWQGKIWDRRKNGEVFPKETTITKMQANDPQKVQYLGIFSDVSKEVETAEQMTQLAFFDPLTGLANRTLCAQELSSRLKSSVRREVGLAVLFIDLDGFKSINDSMGHDLGDEVLVYVAEQFIKTVRDNDLVSRHGGDEFIIILSDLKHTEEAAQVAEKVIQVFEKPIQLSNGKAVFINASIGISFAPLDANQADNLIRFADSAMYEAKKAGKGQYHFFSAEIEKRAVQRMEMDYKLHTALEKNEFVIHYQPQIDSSTGRLKGAESLVRWQDASGGLVSPAEFIPLAEQTGLINEIGKFVLEESCRQNKAWQVSNGLFTVISVNCSVRQFEDGSLPQLVEATLRKTGLEAQYLKIEVTESLLMSNQNNVTDQLSQLKELGVGISMDDFGTGFSSLSVIKTLPLTDLKIDRAFITHIKKDHMIAQVVIDLAKNMGLQTVAEGAEDWSQVEALDKLGCNIIQGFFYSKPLPAEDFIQRVTGQDFQKIEAGQA